MEKNMTLEHDLDETMDMWARYTPVMRISILKAAGWRTAKGLPDRAARKAVKQDWNDLSPAMQRVLSRYMGMSPGSNV